VNTDASVQDAVDDANGAMSLILMFGLVVPLGAIVLGLVLGAIGIWLLRKRSDGMPVEITTPQRELQNV
jgi:hypothetical protein